MNETSRKKIIFSFFIVATVWALYNFLPKEDKQIQTTSPVELKQILHSDQIPQTNIIDIENESERKWGRDPFKYQRNAQVASENVKTKNRLWKLSGIIHNNQSPVAIINKKTVKIGDKIDGAKVLHIDKKVVIIDYNGSKITLRVLKG
ncbi:type II secretion system protein N [Candidatus Zixiibacteriota bacterium]